MELEEALQVVNEHAQKFEQFMYSQMNQTLGGGYGSFVGDGKFGGVGGQRQHNVEDEN